MTWTVERSSENLSSTRRYLAIHFWLYEVGFKAYKFTKLHTSMSENGPQRSRPFVLLTGTPGTGKTTTASLIAVRKNGETISFVRRGFLLEIRSKYDNENTEAD